MSIYRYWIYFFYILHYFLVINVQEYNISMCLIGFLTLINISIVFSASKNCVANSWEFCQTSQNINCLGLLSCLHRFTTLHIYNPPHKPSEINFKLCCHEAQSESARMTKPSELWVACCLYFCRFGCMYGPVAEYNIYCLLPLIHTSSILFLIFCCSIS